MLVLIAMPKYKKLQAYTDDLNRVTRENLTGVNVVRAYNAEKYQEDKSEKANQNLTKANLFAFRTISFLFPSIQLVMNGLTLAIYWIGAVLIEKAAIGMKLTLFSDMVVFSSYAMQILMSFILLTAIMIILPRASVSAHRINEVLDTKASILDGKGVEVKEEEKGTVEFRDVSFRYPGGGGNVLEHISFKAEKGQTVAFIGATGCGKTTLINLIPRFYDVTEGQVLVDGKDVRDYKQEDLRDRIGYVAQKAVLFSGDVASNVGYAYDEALADEQVDRAVRIAQASDFVSGPEGRQKYVAQGGSNFSGGQKQRLSIARAVAKDPEIYIFDDSFSALDYRTDRAVRSALKKECHDATRLIVAQRIGTIRDADLIIVLADGKAVGQGTHEELMKNCAEYQAIASSQLSAKELAA
jgi:ATP-binding cassette subfamily B protein